MKTIIVLSLLGANVFGQNITTLGQNPFGTPDSAGPSQPPKPKTVKVVFDVSKVGDPLARETREKLVVLFSKLNSREAPKLMSAKGKVMRLLAGNVYEIEVPAEGQVMFPSDEEGRAIGQPRFVATKEAFRFALETDGAKQFTDGDPMPAQTAYEAGIWEQGEPPHAIRLKKFSMNPPALPKAIPREEFLNRLQKGETFAVTVPEVERCQECKGMGTVGSVLAKTEKACPSCDGTKKQTIPTLYTLVWTRPEPKVEPPKAESPKSD